MFSMAGVMGQQLVNVPTGKVWILRDIDCYCNVGELGTGEIYIRDWSYGNTFWHHVWWPNIGSTANTLWAGWQGRQVIPWEDGAGILSILQSGDTAVDVRISGYELTPPPT
jgi:hypothetical protein